MELQAGLLTGNRIIVVVIVVLAGLLAPVTHARAETVLPAHRMVYVQRVHPPQQTTYCGLGYITRIVAADVAGGGNERILYTNSQICYPLTSVDISPDRTQIAATIGGGLMIIDVGGTAQPRWFQHGYCSSSRWNHDGSRILCSWSWETFRIVDPVTLNILATIPAGNMGIRPQDADWLPDGSVLVAGDDKASDCPGPGSPWRANVWRLDMIGNAVSGQPRPLLPTGCDTARQSVDSVQAAPDGTRFSYRASQAPQGMSIRVAGVDGSGDRLLAAGTATYDFGRSTWSLSGRKIITERLQQDDTSPFGMRGHIDTIDVVTGSRGTSIPATSSYDALAPSTAEPVDVSAPVVHGSTNRAPDSNGWFNHSTTITWSATDDIDPVEALTVPPPTTAATEGRDVTYTSGPSCDSTGNCATGTVTLSLDRTPPVTTISAVPDWVASAVALNLTSHDNLSGVARTFHTVDDGPVTESSTVGITSEGIHTVSFWSADTAGNIEQAATARVQIDKGAPVITAEASPAPNSGGWRNSPVTVSFTCSDNLSGVAACTPPVTLTQDGANQSVSGTATDLAGNQASLTIENIGIDTTRPTITPVAFSANPKRTTEATTITTSASDSLSGVVGGEYFVGADPGPGAATPLSLAGNTLSATISGLAAGLHPVGVRARDAAGNWSATTTDTLVVYDPSGGFVTAAGRIVPAGPTADPGDTLPGLDHSSSANIHFQMRYKATETRPAGTLAFSYRAGGFELDSTVLDWVVIADGTATVQGTATIRGRDGTFPFRLVATADSQHVLLRVCPAGVNPGSGVPLHQASGNVVGRLIVQSR